MGDDQMKVKGQTLENGSIGHHNTPETKERLEEARTVDSCSEQRHQVGKQMAVPRWWLAVRIVVIAVERVNGHEQ